MSLDPNETIRSLVAKHTLNAPNTYVLGVLRNMAAWRREHPDSVPIVRVGVSGDGRAPHYRVSPLPAGVGIDDNPEIAIEEIDQWLAAKRTGEDPHGHFAVYRGTGHGELELSPAELTTHNWSGARMTYEEVEALLGELRGIKKG